MQFCDQIGHHIELAKKPKRIISLVPSQSELLWDLGLTNELIGITKFCIHPESMFLKLEKIGGTKQLNIEKIKSLKPDLIIANKEENDKVQIEILQKEFSVWTSCVDNFQDALEMINRIGIITEKEAEANTISNRIKSEFSKINAIKVKGKKVAYFMWHKPYMVAANNTFINALIEEIGLVNVFKNRNRYPIIGINDIIEVNPDFVFLSSEPFPFKDIHVKEMLMNFPNSKIILVDGEMFSWYGSRLQKSPSYFNALIEVLYSK